MQDTRLSIIKFAIYLAMLIGLLLMLPEEHAISNKIIMTGYPASDNIIRVIVSPHSKAASETAVMSYSIHSEPIAKSAGDKRAHIVRLKSQPTNAAAMQF